MRSWKATGMASVPQETVRWLVPPAADHRADAADCARVFAERTADPAFPCYFARAALSSGDIHLAYLPAESDIPPAMRAAARLLRNSPKNIVVLFVTCWRSPDLATDAGYARRFLRLCRDADTTPWPPDVPTDPDHPLWCFYFEDVDLFLNFNSPNHRLRRSRSLGPHFTVVIQRRSSFDAHPGVTSVARSHIRSRLTGYDDVDPHPALGTFGEPDNREAAQYFLGDTNQDWWSL